MTDIPNTLNPDDQADKSALSVSSDNVNKNLAHDVDESPGLAQITPDPHVGAVHSSSTVLRSKSSDETIASELLHEQASVAEQDVFLSPAEEREIRDAAESSEDADEMREEMLQKRKKDRALRQAKEKVNPSVPARLLSNRPSSGIITASIEYHMRESYAFLMGRSSNTHHEEGILDTGEFSQDDNNDRKQSVKNKSRIIGLFEAARGVNELVQGYIAGCPYATWHLIRIEEEISDIRNMLDDIREIADNLTSTASNIVINPITARRPALISLTFRNPYSFHFADILTEYDNLVRRVKPYA
ncbi:MAG: AcaB family transcriptional regulator [Cardiobacteriaceae bacterium]|nr:AcaB family transcriptional regulator [Cardiobacteriaceae bacterium]